MFEKLKNARQMRKFICSYRNRQNKKLFLKCYMAYILKCCILFKEEFEVEFGSEYYDSFKLRVKDWIDYIWNNIKVYFWKLIPTEERPSIIEYYIKNGVRKPIHLKHHIFVNESALEYFLDEHGLEIASEYLTSLSSTYNIKKKQNNKKGD